MEHQLRLSKHPLRLVEQFPFIIGSFISDHCLGCQHLVVRETMSDPHPARCSMPDDAGNLITGGLGRARGGGGGRGEAGQASVLGQGSEG